MTFKTIEGSAALQWLDEVSRAADANTHELGFYPRNVFKSFGGRGLLNVLVHMDAKGQPTYAGHLLFEARYPRATVRQMYVDEPYRRLGGASRLLGHLVQSLSSTGFIAIHARVGEDLVEANAFWERHHFGVQRIEAGGASKGRMVLVRCRELDTPQLFPPCGLNETNPLGVVIKESVDLPLFLLDMNVLFDVSKPRRPRHDQAIGLIQAERMNFCRLGISDEIRNELKRCLGERQTDPMAAYLDLFPEFPIGMSSDDGLMAELAELVFPRSMAARPLNDSELSDLRHLVCTINNDLAGLITNDDAILDAGPEIQKRYGVEVVPSGYFLANAGESTEARSFSALRQARLDLLPMQEGHGAAVKALLTEKQKISTSDVTTQWLPFGAQSRVATSQGVWSGQACIGFITRMNKPSGSVVVVRAAVDNSHPLAFEASRIMLLQLIESLTEMGHCQIRVELPAHQSTLREMASGLGFVSSRDGSYLAKSILGRVVMPQNWAACRSDLTEVGGPRLPETAPHYRSYNQQLPIVTADGNRTFVSLERLESFLCPALFYLPGRPAVITPIERRYAEPLLGHSPQQNLLSEGTASLFRERHYLSSPKTLGRFKRGMLMFFYESGKDHGAKQIVAVARVREVFLKASDTLDETGLQQSVLTVDHLKEIGKADMKTVTVFDNIFHLPNPIGLKTLKDLGCGEPNHLITTRALTDEQVCKLLAVGFAS